MSRTHETVNRVSRVHHNHNKDVHDTSATVKCMSACQHLLAFQYQDSIKPYQTETHNHMRLK